MLSFIIKRQKSKNKKKERRKNGPILTTPKVPMILALISNKIKQKLNFKGTNPQETDFFLPFCGVILFIHFFAPSCFFLSIYIYTIVLMAIRSNSSPYSLILLLIRQTRSFITPQESTYNQKSPELNLPSAKILFTLLCNELEVSITRFITLSLSFLINTQGHLITK